MMRFTILLTSFHSAAFTGRFFPVTLISFTATHFLEWLANHIAILLTGTFPPATARVNSIFVYS